MRHKQPITIIEVNVTNAVRAGYLAEAVERGYSFECQCGELHRSSTEASQCKRCRAYLIEPMTGEVTHWVTE